MAVIVSPKPPCGLDISTAISLRVEIAFVHLIRFAGEADIDVGDNAYIMENI